MICGSDKNAICGHHFHPDHPSDILAILIQRRAVPFRRPIFRLPVSGLFQVLPDFPGCRNICRWGR
jgi:ribonuclease BN (tRNA processing enzyme)